MLIVFDHCHSSQRKNDNPSHCLPASHKNLTEDNKAKDNWSCNSKESMERCKLIRSRNESGCNGLAQSIKKGLNINKTFLFCLMMKIVCLISQTLDRRVPFLTNKVSCFTFASSAFLSWDVKMWLTCSKTNGWSDAECQWFILVGFPFCFTVSWSC